MNFSKPLRLLIFGMQGSGKGTQAKILKNKYGICHIAPGDIFREEISSETDLGKELQKYVTKGLLVPDEITIAVLGEYLQKDSCKKGFILDGFPRNQVQQDGLQELLQKLKLDITAVIFINISEVEVQKRLLGRRICSGCQALFNVYTNPPKQEDICDACGEKLQKRSDANEEAIIKRIEIYKKCTFPLLDFYNKSDLLLKIEGKQSIDTIHNQIVEKLYAHLH